MSAICLNETTTHKDKTKTYIKDKHQETFVKKAQHGLVYRKQKAITDYSKENSNSWLLRSRNRRYTPEHLRQNVNSLLIRHSTKLAAIIITTPRTFSTYSVLVRNYQPDFTCLSDTTKYANSYTMH